MALHTVLLTRDVSVIGTVNLTGAATRWQALGDNSNASYIDLVSGPPEYFGGIGTFTLSAGEAVRAVRVNLRFQTGSGTPDFYVNITDPFGQGTPGDRYTADLSGGFQDVVGGWQTSRPDGEPWTAVDVSNLQVHLKDTNLGSTTPTVAEIAVDILTNEAPTVTGTSPNGVATSNKPTFGWSYSDPDGDPQERFRVRVFALQDASAGGFDPNVAAPAVDSGEVFSSATGWQVPTPLDTGKTYRAFISVADAGSNGAYTAIDGTGPYAYAVIDVDGPAIPTLVGVGSSDPAAVGLTATSIDNLMSPNGASAETGLTGIVGSNCTLANPTVGDAAAGTNVVRATASGPGDISGEFDQYTVPVLVGVTYSAAISCRPLTSRRLCAVQINWYNGSNTLISASRGPSIDQQSVASTKWSQPYVQAAVAPAGATHASVVGIAFAAATSEQHEFDAADMIASALWNGAVNSIGAKDRNSDGLADGWSSYNFGSGPDPTFDYDDGNVFIGTRSQRVIVVSNTGLKGWSQPVSFSTGVNYTVSIWVYANTTASLEIFCDRFASSHTVTVNPNIWTCVQFAATATAMPGSGNALVYFRTSTANVTFHWALAQIVQTAGGYDPTTQANFIPNGWTPGGMASVTAHVLECSTDGVKWSLVRSFRAATSLQPYITTGIDYEPPLGSTGLTYRVRSEFASGSDLVTSAYSYAVTPTGLPLSAGTGFWLKCPENPALNIPVNVQMGLSKDLPEQIAVYRPFGRDAALVLHGDLGGDTGTLVIDCMSKSQYQALKALRDAQKTMLLESFDGEQIYIDFTTGLKPVQAYDTNFQVTVDYAETSRP